MAKKCLKSVIINMVLPIKTFPYFRSKRGLTREIVEEISKIKDEPQWMLDFRLKSLELFYKIANATMGRRFSVIKF